MLRQAGWEVRFDQVRFDQVEFALTDLAEVTPLKGSSDQMNTSPVRVAAAKV